MVEASICIYYIQCFIFESIIILLFSALHLAADNQNHNSDNPENVLADSADTNADAAPDSADSNADFSTWLKQDAADSLLIADDQFDLSNQIGEPNTNLGIYHNIFNSNRVLRLYIKKKY